MSLHIQLDRSACADGVYTVHAPGFFSAALYWADENGPLESFTSFAHIPLEPDGSGVFSFTGGRAIPQHATHAAACLRDENGQTARTLLAALPARPSRAAQQPAIRLGMMSDLHLSSKPWRIRRAMRALQETDCVLIAGDLTNDGLPEQFAAFYRCIEEELPGVPVLAVTGNHDYPAKPLPLIRTDVCEYPLFQERLLDRAASLGMQIHADASGAYHARLGGCSFFGLNAVSHFRRFVFRDAAQINDLSDWLASCTDNHRFILCHAPLRRHNPNSLQDTDPPYLSMDRRLQEIVDQAGSLAFISGHTHVSMNDPAGCAEYDAERDVLYLNDSSVTRTTLRRRERLEEPEWVDGAVILMNIFDRETEIAAHSLASGHTISRGFYRFSRSPHA